MAELISKPKRLVIITADPGNTAPVKIEQEGKEPILLGPGEDRTLDRNDGPIMARAQDGNQRVRMVEV